MKILIIQTAFIGDVVLATPLVEKLKRFHPSATIHFLVRQGNESLLKDHPLIEKILIWHKKQHKYRHLWQLLLQIRHERYDWVINCQRFTASGLLTVFSGANTSGFDKNPLAWGFSQRVPHLFGTEETPVHEISRNLALIEHLTDSSFERPRLYPSAEDESVAQQLAGGTPYICMAPTSVWFTKQLPEHKWVELAAAQPKQYLIFLLGGPADIAACERIALAANHPGIRIMAGKMSFLASAALMRNAVMNYVNDSAPLHFASAVNAPVTAFFCSTLPSFGFTPVADRYFVIETKQPLSCRPCGLHGKKACPKGHFECGNTIEFEIV